MSDALSPETILGQAVEQEQQYDWSGAAESHKKALGVFHKQVQFLTVQVVCDAAHQEVKHIEVWKEKRKTSSANCASTRL